MTGVYCELSIPDILQLSKARHAGQEGEQQLCALVAAQGFAGALQAVQVRGSFPRGPQRFDDDVNLPCQRQGIISCLFSDGLSTQITSTLERAESIAQANTGFFRGKLCQPKSTSPTRQSILLGESLTTAFVEDKFTSLKIMLLERMCPRYQCSQHTCVLGARLA